MWKYSDKYDLYVSNLGRMRLPNSKFKFGNGCKGVLTVIYKNKKYRAADIVFETFIKNLKSGYHAYPKDSKYNNITADNLFSTTFKNIDYIARMTVEPKHSISLIVITKS